MTSTELDKNKIIKQGWLSKKSQHLGLWKSRWIVLTAEYLYSFRTQTMNGKVTKIKLLRSLLSSQYDTTFRLKANGTSYLFKAQTQIEKQNWIDILDKYTKECVKIPIIVECARNTDFNDNFELIIPYNQKKK
eukprot:411682_1